MVRKNNLSCAVWVYYGKKGVVAHLLAITSSRFHGLYFGEHNLNLELNGESRAAWKHACCNPLVSLGLWKARNSKFYANKANCPNILVDTAVEEADEWIQENSMIAQESTLMNWPKTNIETRWLKPPWGCLKCNVHASWIKKSFHCGGAWILRNHVDDYVLHARDTFLPMVNRTTVELHCILWCLQSFHNVRIDSCEIWSDCSAGIWAFEQPEDWPKYRSLLSKIDQVIQVTYDVNFKIS